MTKKNQESNRERKKTKTKKSKSYNIYSKKHIRIKKNLIIKQLTCEENIEVTHTKNIRMESN